MVVAGDCRHSEQRLRVRPAASRLQRSLVRQERRALHEEYGKRRQADVRHRVAPVAACSPIRQRGASLSQRRYVAFKLVHPEFESRPDSAAKLLFVKMRSAAGGGQGNRVKGREAESPSPLEGA